MVDASGDVSKESHEMAVQRMVQAGAVPVTWLAVMLEWQGDWKRSETGAQVQKIAQEHGAPGVRVSTTSRAWSRHASKKRKQKGPDSFSLW